MMEQTPFDITGKVQPVDPKYCHTYDENANPVRVWCNYFDGFNRCFAFQEDVKDDDNHKAMRCPKCLERERIVALELNGQMRIEESK